MSSVGYQPEITPFATGRMAEISTPRYRCLLSLQRGVTATPDDDRALLAMAAAPKLLAALRDMYARFDALRIAAHSVLAQRDLESLLNQYNICCDRRGIDSETQPALVRATEAIVAAGETP